MRRPQTVALRIKNDGTVCFIYDDNSPLLRHARAIHVERASDVRFDNDIKAWIIDGCTPETRKLFNKFGTFSRRDDAIAAEVVALTSMLTKEGE